MSRLQSRPPAVSKDYGNRLEQVPPINHQRITELRDALGETKLKRLLSLLEAELAKRADTIRQSDRDDLRALQNDLHNFGGMVASFGLQRVAIAARMAEISCPGVELECALERLETEVQHAVVALALKLS